MSANWPGCKHCSQPRFHRDFHHRVVWWSVKPGLESFVNAKKSGQLWPLLWQRALGHGLRPRFQPPFQRQTLATGLNHASSGMQSKPCSGEAVVGIG